MNLKRQVAAAKMKRRVMCAGAVTRAMLGVLYDVTNAVGSSLYVDKYSYFSSLRKGAFSDWSNTKISKNFYELKRNGYIKYDNKNDSIEFTDKAKIHLIDRISECIKQDDKLRFISFDIPEILKNSRDGFRRAIKRIGFRQVQKSLWVINKNVGKLVEDICKEYGVEKYVTYIVAESTDINNHIHELLKEPTDRPETK